MESRRPALDALSRRHKCQPADAARQPRGTRARTADRCGTPRAITQKMGRPPLGGQRRPPTRLAPGGRSRCAALNPKGAPNSILHPGRPFSKLLRRTFSRACRNPALQRPGTMPPKQVRPAAEMGRQSRAPTRHRSSRPLFQMSDAPRNPASRARPSAGQSLASNGVMYITLQISGPAKVEGTSGSSGGALVVATRSGYQACVEAVRAGQARQDRSTSGLPASGCPRDRDRRRMNRRLAFMCTPVAQRTEEQTPGDDRLSGHSAVL